MFRNTAFSSSSIDNGVLLLISFLITIIIVVALYAFILPDEKRSSLNKYFRAIHDFLKIKGLMIESILRFIYVFFVIYSIVGGFLTLFDNFWAGLVSMVFGPIVCRLVFEALLLNIILVKNVIEINNHLKGSEGSPIEFSSNFSAEAKKALDSLGKKIQEVTTVDSNNNNVDNPSPDLSEDAGTKGDKAEQKGKFCPKCGKAIPGGGEFCVFCGSSIKWL